jgi:hypothetical protein
MTSFSPKPPVEEGYWLHTRGRRSSLKAGAPSLVLRVMRFLLGYKWVTVKTYRVEILATKDSI